MILAIFPKNQGEHKDFQVDIETDGYWNSFVSASRLCHTIFIARATPGKLKPLGD
jgi:hypothetical protein